MNNIKEITIKKVKGRERDFIAYYYHKFLKSNYSVYFTDSVFGAVALAHFVDMVKTIFNDNNINLHISDEDLRFKNQNILQILTDRSSLPQ